RSSAAFQLDDNGRVLGVVRESSSSVSHQLIEELMVLANHVVAESLLKAGISDGQGEVASEAAVQRPLLRCHPDTEEEVKKALVEILPQELQHRASVDQPLQALLLWCSQELPPIKYEAVCDTVLKSFKEANYMVAEGTEEDVEHWALSLPSYMHFTSPIRRYADVLVHRRLAHILDIDTNTEKPMVQSHQAFLDTLKNAVDVCNTKKRDAQDAQMEEIQIVLSDYVHRSGGIEVDDAVITRILVSDARVDHVPGDESQHEPQSRESRETSEKVRCETMSSYFGHLDSSIDDDLEERLHNWIEKSRAPEDTSADSLEELHKKIKWVRSSISHHTARLGGPWLPPTLPFLLTFDPRTRIFAISFANLLCIDIDEKDGCDKTTAAEVVERYAKSHGLTFRLLETDRGMHAYCTSRT
ncbi:unnamed protein product, partial [Cladocopium goreaui]